MAARARRGGPFFSDRANFVLVHCDTPMTWVSSQCNWGGQWPSGSPIVQQEHSCRRCGARLMLRLVEPREEPG